MSHITISGAGLPPPDGSGAQPVAPPRLNLVELINDDRQWSLYIQALTLLQHDQTTEPLSWFAVSAIHGSPYNLQWEDAGPKTERFGYCVHGQPHFPTWHRPYLALYEQALQAAALQAAQKYENDKDDWIRAAFTLRSPYWDWADPTTYLPLRQVYDTVNFRTVRITTPDGPSDVPNPLLAYTFQVKIDWSFSQYPATVRHPRSPPNPAESIAAFEADVGNNARNGNLQWACWRTLNLTTTWAQFSNQGATQGQTANSLETLHNWMHTRTGGQGHMSSPSSAGFDPLFMLHHTNVDRQLALWQALHPEVWISQQNEPQFVNRDLLPFWKNSNAFHRSTDTPVRQFIEFKATYPEFVGLEHLNDTERKRRIQAKVDALYDPTGRRRGIPVRGVRSAGDVAAASEPVAAQVVQDVPAPQAVLKAAPVPKEAPIPTAPIPAAPIPGISAGQGISSVPGPSGSPGAPAGQAPLIVGAPAPTPRTALQRLDWFIRIRVKKFQLKQSFTVLFFLGSVPGHHAAWRSSPHLIGSHSEFVNSEAEHCANCQYNASSITEGFIDLDDSLERLGLGEQTEEEIEKYIQDNIHWRIQKIDGSVVSAAELEVLEIAVMTVDVTDGDIKLQPVHHDILAHKPGGRVPGHKPYHL